MEVAAWVGALSGAAGVIVAVLAWRRAGRALRAAERRAAAAERRAYAEDRRFRAERSAVLGVRYSHGKAADGAIYCFVDHLGGSVALRVTPEEAAIGGKRFPIQSPEGGFTLGPGERKPFMVTVDPELLRREIDEMIVTASWHDDLGSHREPLTWRRENRGRS